MHSKRTVVHMVLPTPVQLPSHLNGTPPEVTPSGRDGIGRPHDVGREHGAHPVLAGDECGEHEPDEETAHDEARCVRDCGHRGRAWHRDHEKKGRAVPWAHQVADRACREVASAGVEEDGGLTVNAAGKCICTKVVSI